MITGFKAFFFMWQYIVYIEKKLCHNLAINALLFFAKKLLFQFFKDDNTIRR